MRLLPKSIHRCRRYPTKFNSGRDISLKPLPQESYELSTWKRCRVNIDYHVEVENNLYSVPYQLIHEKVEARVTASVVEVLFKGKRVASHPRKKGKGHYSTNPEHMPRSHREHLEWTPSRLLHWAEQSGRATGKAGCGDSRESASPGAGILLLPGSHATRQPLGQ